MVTLSVREVEAIAFHLARQHLAFDEPIPDFSSRFPNVLEGCLAVPFQRFYGRAMYPSLVSKASILFYLMIKDHPFQNGNKRIAITALLVYLLKNKKWLEMDTQELYECTIYVAESKAGDKDYVVRALQHLFTEYLVSRPS